MVHVGAMRRPRTHTLFKLFSPVCLFFLLTITCITSGNETITVEIKPLPVFVLNGTFITFCGGGGDDCPIIRFLAITNNAASSRP